MDRGLLSNPEVVTASRAFVCVRLLTYENAEEGKFLQGVFRGRSGQLENSVFAILAPDGTQLTRGGRSPDMVFGRRGGGDVAENMVKEMKRIAAKYPGKEKEARSLPVFVDLRRALNGASCDLQPLVVIADADEKARSAKVEQMKKLAWNPKFIGAVAYVVVSDLEELALIADTEKKSGVYVVAPDAYGLKGKTLAKTNSADEKALTKALTDGVQAYNAESKDSRKHIRQGRRSGKNWEPEIPVSDPHEGGKRGG